MPPRPISTKGRIVTELNLRAYFELLGGQQTSS